MAINFDVIFADAPDAPFDPCAALAILRPAYMKMRLEGQPQKIMFRDREVWFNKPDLSQWDTVMNDLERQCREKKGLPGRRFAISAGYRGSR